MKAMKLGMLITLISLALVDWFFGLHIEGHRLYWKIIRLPLEIIAWPEDLIGVCLLVAILAKTFFFISVCFRDYITVVLIRITLV